MPAWYDEDGNIHVGRSEAEARQRGGLADNAPLTRDEDVLETWFSSALWAHSTLGWPDEARMRSEGFDRYLPTSVLITGVDIFFFCLACMILVYGNFTVILSIDQSILTGLLLSR